MTVKHFKAQLKADESGQLGDVVARFSVFNVIDDDGDHVLPSFFTDGQEVAMAAWGHAWGDLPPGKGTIRVTPAGAEAHGHFFMDTEHGKQHYETVKAMGGLQEWSFGFRILEHTKGELNGQPCRNLVKGEIYEFSPVLIGANRATSTLDIKAGEPVSTQVDADKAAAQATARKYMDRWLAEAAYADPLAGSYEARIDDLCDAVSAYFHMQAAYADPYGYSPSAVVATFDSYCIAVTRRDGDFYWYVIPYTVDADGDVTLGEPIEVERAFTASIPIEEKAATYIGHTARLMAAIGRYVERSKERAARRAKEGRTLSQANRSMLSTLCDSLEDHISSVRALLEATEPAEKAQERAAMLAVIEAENTLRRLALEYT